MEPEDLEKLAQVKTQLLNKSRLTTLEKLCVTKVYESLILYKEAGLTNLSNLLPKSMCNLIYKEALFQVQSSRHAENQLYKTCDSSSEQKKKLVMIISLLEKDGFYDLNCSLFSKHVNTLEQVEGDKEMIQHIATGSSKLASLVDQRERSKSSKTTSELLSDHYSLHLMPNLVSLEITNYPAKDADLQVISECQLLLKSIELFVLDGSTNITINGLEYLKNLKKLEHIKFSFYEKGNYVYWFQENLPRESTLVRSCLLLMPHLKNISEVSQVARTQTFYSIPSFNEEPIELGLEHLVVKEIVQLPPNVSLPNVRSIKIYQGLPQAVPLFFSSLKKLRYINCEYMLAPKVDQILLAVGNQLTKLSVSKCSGTFDLMRILDMCPNLVQFDFLGKGLNLEDTVDLAHLKGKLIKLKYLSLVEMSGQFQSNGLLHLLFTSCPDLEAILLCGVHVKKAEMDLMNQAMKANSLTCQNLRSLSVVKSFDVKEDPAALPFAEFATEFCVKNCMVLENVCVECPKKFLLLQNFENLFKQYERNAR